MKFEVSFKWTDLMSAPERSYSFPSRPTSFMRRYATPGVYRWAVFVGEELEAVYVGEAEDLLRRLRHYLSPGETQLTNIRLKQYLEHCISKGRKVSLQFLEFEEFFINRDAFVCSQLSDPFVRKAIENLAILETFHLDCEVLNKGKNVIKKKAEVLSKEIAKLNPIERARLIEKLNAMGEAADGAILQKNSEL